ncbi:MAG TPA: alpha/beta hydrolase [Acidimicrobiia bacterium]
MDRVDGAAAEHIGVPGVRRYGRAPFRVAVLHGGPGAPGYLAPVATRLGARRGVLEPLQRAPSLAGQLAELASLLAEGDARYPVTLVGHSWGAVLGYLVAASHPERVRRLVLVASAPFDEAAGAATLATRLSRLDADDRETAEAARAVLDDEHASGPARQAAMAAVDPLFARVDAWDPITLDVGALEDLPDVYETVWREVRALRTSGELVALGARIRCPVLGIHGDYDPHPAAGVHEPLAPVLAAFRWVQLEHCGHTPWLERDAAEPFYALLEAELDRDP